MDDAGVGAEIWPGYFALLEHNSLRVTDIDLWGFKGSGLLALTVLLAVKRHHFTLVRLLE